MDVIFNAHNIFAAFFTFAQNPCRYLATSPMNETSMRVTIHHDSQVHPGFCCGDKCARKEVHSTIIIAAY